VEGWDEVREAASCSPDFTNAQYGREKKSGTKCGDHPSIRKTEPGESTKKAKRSEREKERGKGSADRRKVLSRTTQTRRHDRGAYSEKGKKSRAEKERRFIRKKRRVTSED